MVGLAYVKFQIDGQISSTDAGQSATERVSNRNNLFPIWEEFFNFFVKDCAGYQITAFETSMKFNIFT